MKHSSMVERLMKETGYRKEVVQNILSAQRQLMREALVSQGELHFPELLKLRAEPRKVTVTIGGEKVTLTRVVLYVRPMKSLRKELNSWTSTASL